MGSFARNSPGSVAYRTSKSAANKAMQLLALEFASDKIVVCPVHPGWVQTDMGGPQAPLSPERSAADLRQTLAQVQAQRSPAHRGAFLNHDGTPLPW